MVVIGVTSEGRAITANGYVLAAASVAEWDECWAGVKVHNAPVQRVEIDVAALSPSYPITEWVKGRMPDAESSDALRRAHDAAAVVMAELQRELGARDNAGAA